MAAPAYDLLIRDDTGRRVAHLLPRLDDDAPPLVREGVARRRLVQLGRPCPCDARAELVQPSRAERRRAHGRGRPAPVRHAVVEHDDDCPAVAPELLAWFRARR